MDIASGLSFFSELAFPIAVSAFLLVSTAKQLEKMRLTLVKNQILLALLMSYHDIDIPDGKLDALVKVLVQEENK